MARAIASEPFQANKYTVSFVDGTSPVKVAGFSSVTLPELSVESAEYNEGLGLFSKKYPIKISVTTLTLSRGVTKTDSGFYRWILNCIDGSGYRSNIIISQYHRSDVSGLTSFAKEKASRTITCYHCFPVRYKPSSDFDAHSSEISIEELELDVEYFTVEQK